MTPSGTNPCAYVSFFMIVSYSIIRESRVKCSIFPTFFTDEQEDKANWVNFFIQFKDLFSLIWNALKGFSYRCFDLAKLACEYADQIPEYREEYEEIAQQCRKLSVELLDQCNETSEVQLILQESTGANKYFRHSSYMKYPRLRLAIEHNHKEFVGK